MRKQIEKNIRELAMRNFELYPESYPIENGVATDEAIENAQDLAINYYDNRTELDEKMDTANMITKIDYVEWVCAEFAEWIEGAKNDQNKTLNAN